jgi:hypothetical protein
LLLQWWTSAVDFPWVVSGKPYFSLPAFIPITFELTILLAALGAIAGLMLFALLPMFWHPLFGCRSFERMTTDGFFLSVEAREVRFDPAATRLLLEELGAIEVIQVQC